MNIRASDLAMRFNDGSREIEIFRGLKFELKSGSSTAIIGSSGVGKTTLLYLLAGLERPTSGSIEIGGTSITEAWRLNGRTNLARRWLQYLRIYTGASKPKSKQVGTDLADFRGKNIGFVFQFHFLLPEFDAVENVAMPLLIRGETQTAARARAAELLTRVGLGQRLTHRPGMLSGGEQQRVAIARAVASGPGVILADEPTGNLDQATGAEVIKLLCDLQRETGTTLVVVTHSPDIAGRMDRVLEMTAAELKDSVAHKDQ